MIMEKNQYHQFLYKETVENPICLFFILGMLNIKSTLVEDNMVHCCFLDDNRIALTFTEEKQFLVEHPNYESDFSFNDTILYIFNIPTEYLEDFHKFYLGEYTAISKNLKVSIVYNNISFKNMLNGKIYFHPLVYALIYKQEKELGPSLGCIIQSNRYLEFLEDYFNTEINAKELLQKPHDYNVKSLDDVIILNN